MAMNKELYSMLQEVKKRVEVHRGESPTTVPLDAVRLAERNGLIYRYAQNGPTWGVRWTADHAEVLINEANLCEIICRRIIDLVPERLVVPVAKEKKPKETDAS